MIKLGTLALVLAGGCMTDPALDTAEQDLTQSQVSTLNTIGREVGLAYRWTAASRGGGAALDEAILPIDAVARTVSARGLDGGFEHRLRVDPGAIDPCWFVDVGAPGAAPVVSVRSLRGDGPFGAAMFSTAGSNFTIEGVAQPPDPSRGTWELKFVVRDASGNVVFDSTRY